MGEFSLTLLKLIEFPFSYSLIGLLVLIFGQGTNLEGEEDLSFAKIGPLLILMGFVATTLSICDPVGVIQRIIIKGRSLRGWKEFRMTEDPINASLFRKLIKDSFLLPYLLAIVYSPESVKKKYSTFHWNLIPIEYQEGNMRLINNDIVKGLHFRINQGDLTTIGFLLEGLKQNTVKTKWITAEVDRITALIYFMVIISLFIIAAQLYPSFLQNFTQFFGNIESIKIVITIFSLLALIAVSIMCILRILGLMTKALIVFEYLAALGAIKTDKDNFKSALQDIERYLDDNNWTLAEYLVKNIQKEYTQLFLKKIKE
jgi:hypothetical protein